MKKRMKILAAFMLSLSLVFSLAACSGEGEKKEEKKSSAEVVKEDGKEDAKEKNEAKKEEAKKEETPSIDPVTVVDNDQCKIELTGIEDDDTWGYTLNMLIENKNADLTYTVHIIDAAINNVQTDPFFATDIAPGKKSNEQIYMDNDSWTVNDIGEYTDILLTFEVREANNWEADPVVNETVHIYPLGEDKATVYTREKKDTDQVLLDDANGTVILTGYREDEYLGFMADFYIVNKTDKKLRFSADGVSVNGFMMDPYYADVVQPGRVSYSSMSWFGTDFEDNNVEKVEDISFTLTVTDEDDWSADAYASQAVTLNP